MHFKLFRHFGLYILQLALIELQLLSYTLELVFYFNTDRVNIKNSANTVLYS